MCYFEYESFAEEAHGPVGDGNLQVRNLLLLPTLTWGAVAGIIRLDTLGSLPARPGDFEGGAADERGNFAGRLRHFVLSPPPVEAKDRLYILPLKQEFVFQLHRHAGGRIV